MSAGEATESNFFYQSSRLSFPGTHRKRSPGQNLARIVLCMYYRGTCPCFLLSLFRLLFASTSVQVQGCAFNIGIGPWKVADWRPPVFDVGMRHEYCGCKITATVATFPSRSLFCRAAIYQIQLRELVASTCTSMPSKQKVQEVELAFDSLWTLIGQMIWNAGMHLPLMIQQYLMMCVSTSMFYFYVRSKQRKTRPYHTWSTLSSLDNAVAYKSEVWHADAGWITESRCLVWICKHCKL